VEFELVDKILRAQAEGAWLGRFLASLGKGFGFRLLDDQISVDLKSFVVN
jgi:hypothetical protein